ncbi:hypothetical protein PDE_07988 [Penicillium oxalicum 114-2]|uniref:Uncharacterized protein n=1 Tax=Penicillium oxalicum (strain 114-2 / CGMCC 5302) TaxID=933388 RepID=S8BDF7_PENO1|nr:hypothetical protein PDE_07988 [Penicillium oxalicum 114-2]
MTVDLQEKKIPTPSERVLRLEISSSAHLTTAPLGIFARGVHTHATPTNSFIFQCCYRQLVSPIHWISTRYSARSSAECTLQTFSLPLSPHTHHTRFRPFRHPRPGRSSLSEVLDPRPRLPGDPVDPVPFIVRAWRRPVFCLLP